MATLSDPRIRSESMASQKAYAEAARLMGPTWERIEIPYEGTSLPGYFYKVDDSGKSRPTLVFTGGYDSSVEEMFYFAAAAATRRGYNCLTFDGPGQGSPIRELKLPFRYDWENVVTPVVDYALTRSDVDGENLSLIAMSLGGYFGARTVAFERRFRAAIFYDSVWSFYEALRNLLPKEAIVAFDAGNAELLDEIVYSRMQKNTSLRWVVTQGLWSFGASSLTDFIEKTKQYTIEGIAGQIQCPCLVMEADGDIFFKGQPKQVFDALQSPKHFVQFGSEDGAENHCQSGALAYKDQVVFDWLDETLKLHDRRS